MKTHLIAIVSFLTIVGGLFAAPANHAPITELKDLRTEEAVFTDASRTKPVVLKSLKNGAKYFDKEALAAISKAVDFEKQIVLLFSWKGSGQERLQYVVKESFPEQIMFSYKAGRTRDLRPHVKVYVLRSNVKWTIE
jgi:flagellar motor component MotA